MIATGLFASVLLALFLPLRPGLRVIFGSQWVCVLWLALLLRLLAPWPLQTPWGLMNAWENRVASQPIPESALKVRVSLDANSPAKQNGHPASLARPAAAEPAHSGARVDLLFVTWLAGFFGAAVLLALRGLQTARLAGQTVPATDERLLSIYASIPPAWRRGVALRMSAAIEVPTLAGIVRPQIWMPHAWLPEFSSEELRCVLLHELGHARRGDLTVQWLFAIAGCLHWFNPVVWLASRAARLDREMACDAWVLERENTRGYGETLLKTLKLIRGRQCIPGTAIAMASGQWSLRARVTGIAGYRPARTWPGMMGAVLALAIVVIATSSHNSIGQNSKPWMAASPAPATAAASPAASPAMAAPFVKIEAKFIEMDGKAWKKLREENAEFREATATFGDLEDARKGYPALSGTVADAATLTALKTLGSDNWVFQDGAWQNVSPVAGVAVIWDKLLQEILRYLDGRSGVELLSAPMVTARSGNRALIEIVREFRYPTDFEPDKRAAGGWSPTNFRTQNLGVSLGVTCTFETTGDLDIFGLDLDPDITDFLGFVPEKNGGDVKVGPMPHDSPGYWRPIFSISRGRTSLNVFPGQTVMLAGVRLDRKSDRMDFEQPAERVNAGTSTERRVTVVFVTASIEAPEGVPVSEEKPPYAVAAPGMAGFVTSPFARGGYVDVRGFAKDAKVKDPYSGKIFLVP